MSHTQLCLDLGVHPVADAHSLQFEQGAARQAAVAARRQAAQEHALSHPRFTNLVLAPAPAASLLGLAAAAGAQAANPRFTHLALAGIQPAPAASLQDRSAAADPQPAPAQEQYMFERAYAGFAELGARLDRLNVDTPEAAARDARIYAETLLSMAGATTRLRGTCARKERCLERRRRGAAPHGHGARLLRGRAVLSLLLLHALLVFPPPRLPPRSHEQFFVQQRTMCSSVGLECGSCRGRSRSVAPRLCCGSRRCVFVRAGSVHVHVVYMFVTECVTARGEERRFAIGRNLNRVLYININMLNMKYEEKY